MNILVTGNSGLIGSSIIEELSNDAIEFKTENNPRDLLNKKDILDSVNNVDAIINASGLIPNHYEKWLEKSLYRSVQNIIH